MGSQRLDSHCSYSRQSSLYAMAIVPHAMENKFRREYLWLIITCGQMAQYSRLNTNEFKVTNGKRKNDWRGVKKKENRDQFSARVNMRKLSRLFNQLHLHKF